MPAISVVMPVYNGVRFLDRALTSLHAQTLIDWELIAVDDGSTDNSSARLDTAASDQRIRILHHPVHRGPAAARNTALAAACGEWVAYLEQDCEFDPNHLAHIWQWRDQGDVLVFRHASDAGQDGHPNPGGANDRDPFVVVHRRSLIDTVGDFDLRLEPFAAADLWSRFARSGARFAFVPMQAGRHSDRSDTPVGLPSPVTTVEIQSEGNRFSLRIPARETWRVQQLFSKHEYGGVPSKLLRPNPVVVDVGANVGVFAAYAAMVYRAGTVHCFEPYPPSLSLLRQNIAPFPGVNVHPFGLGRGDTEANLYLDSANSGANSLKPGRVRNPVDRVRVPVRDAGCVWDELGLGEVDVLKVDTEGCEVDVLTALGPRLAQARVVMAEYHTPGDRRRIDALLADHLLFGVLIHSLRQGVVKYVRADLTGVAAVD